MTPPEWFLQLLGGLAVAGLLVLLRPLVGRRHPREPSKSRPRLTPEQQARKEELQLRAEAHARAVMQPGLLKAFFDRDSVAMRDDAERHQCLLVFTQDAPLSVVLGAPIHQVLASISGGQATWVIQLHQLLAAPTPPDAGRVRVTDLAVVAEQWSAPRLLVPDVPVSQVGTGTLYAVYLAQQDPDEVYTALSRREEGDARLQPHVSRQSTDRQFGTLRSLPNPRVQKTYTRYPTNPEEIPAERRVMVRLSDAEPHPDRGPSSGGKS